MLFPGGFKTFCICLFGFRFFYILIKLYSPCLGLCVLASVESFTESRNHRMFGVGRDLWGSSSTTPCRSKVTQSRLHRTVSRQVFNISREGDSTTSLGSLCQCSVTLRGKKFFLMFSWNFLCFSLCPLPLVLSLDTTEKSLPLVAPTLWIPAGFGYLIALPAVNTVKELYIFQAIFLHFHF